MAAQAVGMSDVLVALLRLIDMQLQVWLAQLDPGIEHRAYMLGYEDGFNAAQYSDSEET